MFGYDGYQTIRKRNWTTTSLMLLALGIVSDISEIFGPITKIGLYTSIIAASILGIVILRRLRFCDLCVVPFVLSVIFSVIFGGVAIAQNADPTPGDGVIADFVPGVKEIHKVILAALWGIKQTTDDTNARVAELQGQIQNLSVQHNRKYDEILAKLEVEKGISKSALSEHLVKLGATKEISVAEIPAFLETFANDYQNLKDRLLTLDIDDGQLADIRRNAFKRLEAGDLSGARIVLQDARKILTAGRETSASREAALLADEAEIDRLDLNYPAAAQKFLQAADLTDFDGDLASQYRFNAANIFYRLANEFGETSVLADAIRLYNDLLGYYDRARVPLSWAVTQNNLGNALAKLGERNGSLSLLNDAGVAYGKALEEYSRGETPLDWAMAQNNLGSVFLQLSDRQGGTDLLRDAIDAFQNALLERTRERAPFDWAATKNNIGNAYKELALRTNNPVLMGDAVSAYRDALSEWSFETAPDFWAIAQSNLGNTLTDLGDLEAGTERYVEALAVFDDALRALDRRRAPLMWATVQNNRGWTLLSIGRREQSISRLQEAVSAFQASLEERTRERVPLEWAGTQKRLGMALGNLGWQTGDPARVDDAIAALRLALEENTFARTPKDWVNVQAELGYAFRAKGDLTGQANDFLVSASHFETLANAGLEQIYTERQDLILAEFHQGMCWSLIRAMETQRTLQHFTLAEPACNGTVQALAPHTDDVRRLDALYNLAYLKLIVAEIRSDETFAREALAGFQAIQTDPLSTAETTPRPDVLNEISRAQAVLNAQPQTP